MNVRLPLIAGVALYSALALRLVSQQPAKAATSAFTEPLVLGEGPGRSVAPEGRYVLFAASEDPQKRSACQDLGCDNLWLEDEKTHKRTWIATRNSDLSAGWSPDGNAFYVQDRQASDEGILSVYKNSGARIQSVDTMILQTDPAARELFWNSHHYSKAIRWMDATHLRVRFHGHTDYYPSRCFALDYSVSLEGKLKKLSERVEPASAECPY
jgi:hypothetical protein